MHARSRKDGFLLHLFSLSFKLGENGSGCGFCPLQCCQGFLHSTAIRSQLYNTGRYRVRFDVELAPHVGPSHARNITPAEMHPQFSFLLKGSDCSRKKEHKDGRGNVHSSSFSKFSSFPDSFGLWKNTAKMCSIKRFDLCVSPFLRN